MDSGSGVVEEEKEEGLHEDEAGHEDCPHTTTSV